MQDSDLTKKVPTLKRIDHAEYIHFRLDPLPKLNTDDIKRIKISEVIPKEYQKCFESEYLNIIQTKVFESVYKSS